MLSQINNKDEGQVWATSGILVGVTGDFPDMTNRYSKEDEKHSYKTGNYALVKIYQTQLYWKYILANCGEYYM